MSKLLAVLQKLWLTAYVLMMVLGVTVLVVGIFGPPSDHANDAIGNTLGALVFFSVLYFAGAWWMQWMFTATRRTP